MQAATTAGEPSEAAPRPSSQFRRLGIATLAGSLVLVASLENFLRFHDYPLFSAEVGLVVLGLVGLTLAVALLYSAAGRTPRAVLEGLLVFLAIDINANSLTAAAVAGAVVVAIALVTRRSTLPFIATMAFVALLAGLIGVGAKPGAKTVTKAGAAHRERTSPAILHLIVDEHIGIEGLPEDNPRTPAMQEQLRTFYLSRGFRLYGRAYSQHYHTVNAIPQMLNLGAPVPPAPSPRDGRTLKENRWFDQLARRGYSFNIHQSEFIDYCSQSPEARCTTYYSPGLRVIADAPLMQADKAGLIAAKFALLSQTVESLWPVYSVVRGQLGRAGVALPEMGFGLREGTSMLNGEAAFDDLIRDLGSARPGQVYFAHMLLPHYPYAFGPDCAMRGVDRWLRRKHGPRRARENAYFDQLQCVMKKVDAALAAFEASSTARNHIVLVHGDHGSRLLDIDPTVENAGRYGDREMVAGFSTLFALRAPGIAPGYQASPAAVANLLAQIARSGFAAAPEPSREPPPVMLDDRRWIPRRPAKMPGIW